MDHLFGSLHAVQLIGLILALTLALGFEFVNGFHDTANAVATVIYTHSLPPWVAVIWSGIWNLIGVLTSTGAVAFGVISLLPVELVMDVGSAAGFSMVFSLRISAIVWNLGTWYLGLPASSSHTLIGSIMGVGLMNSMMNSGSLMGGINWDKAKDVGLSLLISPVVGFACTAILFLLVTLVRKPELYAAPEANALAILHSKNEAHRQPVLNRQWDRNNRTWTFYRYKFWGRHCDYGELLYPLFLIQSTWSQLA
jgi:PiT family inorganic phosphate transporter